MKKRIVLTVELGLLSLLANGVADELYRRDLPNAISGVANRRSRAADRCGKIIGQACVAAVSIQSPHAMERTKKDWRWLRALGAVFVGFLLMGIALPSTGCISSGPPAHPSMWRCGPFIFFPTGFFSVFGAVTGSVACTLFGIVRRNAFESVGWILLVAFLTAAMLGA